MHQLGLADDRCKVMHVRLAMMQSALHVYNASSQLVSSAKGTFVDSECKVGYVSRYGKSVPT